MKSVEKIILWMVATLTLFANQVLAAEQEETSQLTDYEMAQLIKPAFKYDEAKAFPVDALKGIFAEILDEIDEDDQGFIDKADIEIILPADPTIVFTQEVEGHRIHAYVAVDEHHGLVLRVHYDGSENIPVISWVNQTGEMFEALNIRREDLSSLVETDDLEAFEGKLGQAQRLDIFFSAEAEPVYVYNWYNADPNAPQVGEIVAVEVRFQDGEIIEYGFYEKE